MKQTNIQSSGNDTASIPGHRAKDTGVNPASALCVWDVCKETVAAPLTQLPKHMPSSWASVCL